MLAASQVNMAPGFRHFARHASLNLGRKARHPLCKDFRFDVLLRGPIPASRKPDMNTTANGFLPRELLRILGRYPLRLLVPAAIVCGVVGVYALLRPNSWEASQALVVRNEAGTKLGQE